MTFDLAVHPETGDIYLDGSEIATVRGIDAIAQEIQVELRWWFREWFLDRSRGAPYLEQILGHKGVSEATIRSVLRRVILRVPGVLRIDSMRVSIDRETRKCVVDEAQVITTEGPLPLSSLQVGG